MSDIIINAASYVSANTQADSVQGAQATTAGHGATETDGVNLSTTAQARLMSQQGMTVAEIAANLGMSVQAVSSDLDLTAASVAVPTAAPQPSPANQ
jgi:hypothetical protein